MSAALGGRVDAIADEVRRVVRLADELAAAAVDLSESWDHHTVHDAVRAGFRAQDAAAEVATAATRLEEVAR